MPSDDPSKAEPKSTDEVVKTLEELFAMGGMFYTLGDEHWCDTAFESWKLEFRKGYVKQ